MLSCFTTHDANNATPIVVILAKNYSSWLNKQKIAIKKWLESNDFHGKTGDYSLIPDSSGNVDFVLFCIANFENFWCVGKLPFILPEGVYRFESLSESDDHSCALVWGLGAYQFTRYKKALRNPAQLFLSKKNLPKIENKIQALWLVRDLINTPADDMGPTELGEVATRLVKKFNGKMKQIIGENLLTENYPCIYTVGRASDDPPRLIDFHWGNKKHPGVTLVGKGVCFDTGGLDIKPCVGMGLMKKDMGGAAHVLGLAQMIMTAQLPIYLRVLIPAVENSIAGNAYRPGDIIKSRKGLTIEIGNTDAEGRLVLADALTEAVDDHPELLIDMSTLTGAARIALGPDLPAFFANQDIVANDVIRHANEQFDPIWRMPLFSSYRSYLDTPFADINNCGALEGYGGAITAALFLKEFVPDSIPWLHFDLMAWNLKSSPGKPLGGEAMGVRALFSYLEERFS